MFCLRSTHAHCIILDLDGLLVLWDISVNDPLQEISCIFNGPITVAAWIPTERGNASAFAFGCADGSIHIYAQLAREVNICRSHSVGTHTDIIQQSTFTLASITNAHDGPVEDMAFDNTHRRLASIGHGTLQIWTLKDDRKSFNCASRCR